MAEFSMKRNASGYIDHTAYDAYRSTIPQAGEIWTNSAGTSEYLIIRSQRGFCNTLCLLERVPYDCESIEVIGTAKCVVNPSMLSFVTEPRYGRFVKKIPDDMFRQIVEKVGESLDVTITITEKDDMTADMLRKQCDDLESSLRDAKEMIAKYECLLEESNEAIMQSNADLAAAKEKIRNATSTADGMQWKQMYNDLLDKVIERGR